MSDILQKLTYALGHHHWGRTQLLEEARAEILRLRRENATLSLQVPPENTPTYRGRHLRTLTEELEELGA